MNPPICPLELPTPLGLAGIGARVGESPRPGAGSDSQTPGARQEPAQGTSPWAPGPKKDGRRGRNRDGLPTPRRGVREVSNRNLTVVWTPAEFRAAVTELRALAADNNDSLAPVIDITSRERLA